MNHLISIDNYPIINWIEKYPDYQVNLKELNINSSYNNIFQEEFKKPYFYKIEKYLSHALRVTNGKINIYPYPDLIFNAFNTTPLDNIKVVILGQDPYHKNEIYNGKIIPQAMGLSFSVPKGITIPSSLNNIYINQLKYRHIFKMPSHGNITSWAYQGCLLLNTSLTVQHGFPNSHSKYWQPLTDTIIKYISDKLNNIVFVLWGKPAFGKLKLIDCHKHKIIITSHPSGLSFNKPMNGYPPFMDFDHFGEINKFLIKNGKEPILWKII